VRLRTTHIHPVSEQFILILAKNVASIERDIRPWNATTSPVWPLGSDDNSRPRAASMDGHDQTDQTADSPSRRRSGLVRKHHLIYCLREDSPLSGPIGLHQTPKALRCVPLELSTWNLAFVAPINRGHAASPLHLRFSERHVGLASDSKYSARHSLKCRRNGVGVFSQPGAVVSRPKDLWPGSADADRLSGRLAA
jgi:hypothetical protein